MYVLVKSFAYTISLNPWNSLREALLSSFYRWESRQELPGRHLAASRRRSPAQAVRGGPRRAAPHGLGEALPSLGPLGPLARGSCRPPRVLSKLSLPPVPVSSRPRPSSYLLLESLLLCFLLHALLLGHQLLSQTVGFLEEEGQVAGKERESNKEASMEGS